MTSILKKAKGIYSLGTDDDKQEQENQKLLDQVQKLEELVTKQAKDMQTLQHMAKAQAKAQAKDMALLRKSLPLWH